MRNIFTKTILLFTALMTLNACGVKPNSVESPSAGKDNYPHTYPAPSETNKTVQF